jgi:hypothetical protein
MIELNLLPDVKLEYIKAQNARRVILVMSVLVTAASLTLLIVLFSVSLVQKRYISHLSTDIQKSTNQLKGKKDISKILTVQNQLASLTSLHASKPAVPQTLSYLNSVTPVAVSINDFKIDYLTQTMTITGDTGALSDINQYIDTLKYTTYLTDADEKDSTGTKAFSNVVLTAFALNQVGASQASAVSVKPATYTITLNYDPAIFDITSQVKLRVPSITTTRVQLERPNALFEAAPPSKGAN